MENNILDVELTDKQFAALSYKTRRDILRVIYDAAMSPREIAQALDITTAMAKRHLRILQECGLVQLQLRGNTRFYLSNHDILSL